MESVKDTNFLYTKLSAKVIASENGNPIALYVDSAILKLSVSEILKLVSPEFESHVYEVYKKNIKDKIKNTIEKW